MSDIKVVLPNETTIDLGSIRNLVCERNLLVKYLLKGKEMREAQKTFYRKRKKATPSEHKELLDTALKLEKEFDEALMQFVSTVLKDPFSKPSELKQESLL